MKNLFGKLKRLQLYKNPRNLILIDSCFFIDVFEKNKQNAFETLCEYHDVAITSFNAEEVAYNIHRFRDKTKEYMKHFLKNTNMMMLEIAVSPGSRNHEEEFINRIDPELLEQVHDPSDAVLVATAIQTRSTILTKDKHHLFTAHLNNFLHKYDVPVFKELKDVLA